MSRFNEDPTSALTVEQVRALNFASGQFKKWALAGRLSALEAGAGAQGTRLDATEADVSALSEGFIAYNQISAAVNPTAGDRITVGADTYEFVAAGGNVSNNGYIGVVRGTNLATSMANLIAGIHASYGSSELTGLFRTNGTTPALKNGTTNVFAFFASNVLHLVAAGAPGGTPVSGTTPSIACSDNLTEVTAWTFANLNLSTASAIKHTKVARVTFAVTAPQIAAGSVVVRVPAQSASMRVVASATTAAGAQKALGADTVAVAAVTGSATLSNVTITLNGGGGDLAATDILFIEVLA